MLRGDPTHRDDPLPNDSDDAPKPSGLQAAGPLRRFTARPDRELASAERAAQNRVGRALADDTLNLAALIPEHFGRYFAFFTPGHTQGIVPTRIKELARLKIAALNQCDT